MPGTKRYSAEELRYNIWRGLEIMRTATIPELTGVIEGIGVDSIRKAVRQLEIHGYVIKAGTRGGHTCYAKTRRIPLLPPVCGACGAEFTAKTCDPFFKEKEREREREKSRPANHPEWHQVPADLKARLERLLNGDDEEVPHDAA